MQKFSADDDDGVTAVEPTPQPTPISLLIYSKQLSNEACVSKGFDWQKSTRCDIAVQGVIQRAVISFFLEVVANGTPEERTILISTSWVFCTA